MKLHPLQETWRWFGPKDTVSLADIKQAGAAGIVSAMHHVPHGQLWSVEDIQKRKEEIERAGLRWSVVESIPVHENIKTRSGNYKELLEVYKQSLRNVSAAGVKTVCYNFMPVLDWTRTELDHTMPDGSKSLWFDWVSLALFDVHILKRKGAEQDYDAATLQKAEHRFQHAEKKWLDILTENILMGVPGEASIPLEQLLKSIEIYKAIGGDGLRENLAFFLESIMDVCEEQGIKMTIHPDDPPFDILGLPRIMSNKNDLIYILKKVDRMPNGICFCTGSLGAGKDNDLPDILKAVGDRVYFVHLRNVRKEKDRSFYEADHLDGDTDMYEVMKELLKIQQSRKEPIPFRPDHGHQMLDDLNKETFPGYSAIGRLRGLAELRGLAMGISKSIVIGD
ncbi:MAG: mannonate dehydratase [Chitinophagaceae bacterium]|nr:mannonate dehydratase [Chitinophagaceae bacterium]